MDMSTLSIVIGVLSLISGGFAGLLVVWAKMAKYQQKVDDLKEEKDKMLTKIESLRTDVDMLKEFKVNAQKFIDKSLYQASSPLSLTVLGKELVEQSGFVNIFEQEKQNLAQMLEIKQPTTKYDVQEMARELMDDLKEYPAFASIKSYAYSTGKDFGQILRAGAILLRDYYLSIHPEIKN
jgi:hypothetical protein